MKSFWPQKSLTKKREINIHGSLDVNAERRFIQNRVFSLKLAGASLNNRPKI